MHCIVYINSLYFYQIYDLGDIKFSNITGVLKITVNRKYDNMLYEETSKIRKGYIFAPR